MLTRPDEEDALRVLVVTPLGQAGAGGIDRVVDQLRTPEAQRPNLTIDFVVSRGARVIGSLYNMPHAIWRIATAAVRRRVDVVHLNVASNSSAYRKVLLSWVCRLAGVPYVVHLHGARFHKFWPGLGGWRRRAVDGFFRHAGSIIVLGEVWRDFVVGQIPATADRIFVVPNATQRRATAAGSGDTPNILFLGRLGERKGVPDLVRALGEAPRDAKWTATLAGDGDIEGTKRQVRELGLDTRVAIPGWAGPADVERLIDKADILALPSYDENLPMSVIEGMAAGLAVVATPVGATGDVIKHGETGMLVNPGDVHGLASALTTLVSDAAMRRRLGDAAQALHRQELDATGYVDRLMAPWRFAAGHRSSVK